jgi:hypothetical protein
MKNPASPAWRPRNPPRARVRRPGGDPADGPARPPRGALDRRGCRNLKTSREGSDWGEQPQGARLRSCLSRGLGTGRDREPRALAGARGPVAEICRPSPLGSRPARNRSHSRHAGGDRGGFAGEQPVAHGRPPCAVDRAPAACKLVDLHHWKGAAGPFASPALRAALRLAVRAMARPRSRKSESAVTKDVLEKLLATCARGRLADTRDAALLLVAFASDGRRRSEVISAKPVHTLCAETGRIQSPAWRPIRSRIRKFIALNSFLQIRGP